MTRYTLLCLPLFFVFNSTIENQKKETFEDIRKMPTNVDYPPPASLMPKFDLKQSKRKLDFSTPIQDLKPVLQKDSTAMQTTHHADNVDIDPIEVELVSLKDSLTIDEIFELKVNIHYRPRLLTSVPPDWNGFALKVVLPNGFEQIGGDYYDFVEGNLSESNASKSYSIIGKFTAAADSLPCFKAIRSTIGARNESTFWQKQNKCFVIKKEKVEETAFDPFLENVKLMDRLKGKIEPEKEVNKNARLSALVISRRASSKILFGYCDKITFDTPGFNMNNLYVIVSYDNGNSWKQLSNTECTINVADKSFYIERKEFGFLPTGDFKIGVTDLIDRSIFLNITLETFPTLSSCLNLFDTF